MKYDAQEVDCMVENLCAQVEQQHEKLDEYEKEIDERDSYIALILQKSEIDKKIIESLERQVEMLEDMVHGNMR